MAIFIHGPTACGKSALALALAEQIGGEIVNADSMQVYRDLSRLTARPTAEETSRVPHHLYGHVDAAQAYSVGHWLGEAGPCIADIRRRGRLPIVVGGTGLAFMALQGGLSVIPPVTAGARARAEAVVASGRGAEELARCDPVSASRIEANDGHRLLRALAVHYSTGRPLGSFHERSGEPLAPPWIGVTLTPPRPWVHARIEERFVAALSDGAVEEARALGARGLDPHRPISKSHGLKWILAWLDGKIGHSEMYQRSCADMRRYAKRQYTWAAHQLPSWPRIAATTLNRRLQIVTPRLVSEIDDMAQGGGRAA